MNQIKSSGNAIVITLLFALLLGSAQTLPAERDVIFSRLHGFRELEMQAWVDAIKRAPHHDNRQEQFDSRFTTIDIQIFVYDDSIHSTVETQFQSLVDGLTEIRLDFDETFAVDSVSGNAAGFSLVEETLTVTLDQTYNTGELFSIVVTYHGQPQIIGGLKGFRFETHGVNVPVVATLCTPYLSHYWWPCVDGPADKLDSIHLTITIPDTTYVGYPLYAASNGKIVDTIHHGNGWVSYEWHENYPIVPYYVSISISNYRIFSHTYNGTNTMDVPYYVFPEDYNDAQQTFAETVDMITYFANLFGEYPFITEKYSMAEIGFYGAIENQTKTIMGGVDPGWYMVVCHELSHMWFADMISPVSWHHCWINEGFATYCEALWWGHLYGMQEYHDYIYELRYLGAGTIYLEDISDPWHIFIGIVYDKGAWVLHMLRHVVGDSVFFDILHTYATDPRFMYKNASTEDFQGVCEQVSGMDLSTFFDQWIYDERYPRYEYSWISTQRDNGRYQVQVTIKQVQKEFGWRPLFEMPIDLVFELPSGDTTIVVWNNDTLQYYQLDLAEEPIALHFDPDDWILRFAAETGAKEFGDRVAGKYVLDCAPNPFSKLINISFAVDSRQKSVASIRIYDITGRLVQQFNYPTIQLSNHITWSGDDQSGHPLPAGIYFVRLNNATTSVVQKIVLLK